MRHFTTEHTVYSFDELTDDAKQKAIESQHEFEYEMLDGWLPDEMQYKLNELLPLYGMTCDDAKAFYSLGYSQGDGAMFEGTIFWKAWRVEVKQSGHYYHYNSKTFWNTESVKTGKDMPNKTAVEFNDLYVELCKELAKAGYSAIEGATTDESLADNIRMNEYEFYADGRQV